MNAKSQNVFGFEYERKSYDQVIVNNVLKNSPADKCGIQKGDYLVSINDDYFGNKNADEIARLFQNAPNSNNTIQFYRKWGFEKFSSHVFMLGGDAQTDWLMKKELLQIEN